MQFKPCDFMRGVHQLWHTVLYCGRHGRRASLAVFCCVALMTTPATAAVQWNRVGVVTTLTNGQLWKTDGTNVVCDSTTPTIASGLVGIGSVGPISSLDMSQKTDAVALPVGTSGNRPTGGNLTAGEIRYNQATPGVEAYVNGAWVTLQSGSGTWSGGTITVPYG